MKRLRKSAALASGEWNYDFTIQKKKKGGEI
jgi:hypothetical protein